MNAPVTAFAVLSESRSVGPLTVTVGDLGVGVCARASPIRVNANEAKTKTDRCVFMARGVDGDLCKMFIVAMRKYHPRVCPSPSIRYL